MRNKLIALSIAMTVMIGILAVNNNRSSPTVSEPTLCQTLAYNLSPVVMDTNYMECGEIAYRTCEERGYRVRPYSGCADALTSMCSNKIAEYREYLLALFNKKCSGL